MLSYKVPWVELGRQVGRSRREVLAKDLRVKLNLIDKNIPVELENSIEKTLGKYIRIVTVLNTDMSFLEGTVLTEDALSLVTRKYPELKLTVDERVIDLTDVYKTAEVGLLTTKVQYKGFEYEEDVSPLGQLLIKSVLNSTSFRQICGGEEKLNEGVLDKFNAKIPLDKAVINDDESAIFKQIKAYVDGDGPSETVPILLGATAVSKSATIKHIAKITGRRVVEWRLGFMSRLDFEGLSERKEENGNIYSYNSPQEDVIRCTDEYIDACAEIVVKLKDKLQKIKQNALSTGAIPEDMNLEDLKGQLRTLLTEQEEAKVNWVS